MAIMAAPPGDPNRTEPDVFYLKPQLAPDLMSSGRLVDLKPAMDASGLSKSDFYEQLVDIFSVGDKIFGLPKDFGTQVAMVLNEAPVPLRKRRPGLPEPLARVVHRALERDPSRRFADVRAMRAALAPFAG